MPSPLRPEEVLANGAAGTGVGIKNTCREKSETPILSSGAGADIPCWLTGSAFKQRHKAPNPDRYSTLNIIEPKMSSV